MWPGAKSTSLDLASVLLEVMQRRSQEPDMITYSAAISACEKGKQPDKALELLEDMQWEGFEPNVIN